MVHYQNNIYFIHYHQVILIQFIHYLQKLYNCLYLNLIHYIIIMLKYILLKDFLIFLLKFKFDFLHLHYL